MKLFALIAALLTVFSGNAAAARTSTVYAETAQIVSIDREQDLVTVETAVGHQFAFYGCEDYCEGWFVNLLMSDNGTTTVTDDIILQVTYSGYYLDATGFHDSRY